MANGLPEFLLVPEVAEILKVNPDTARALIKSGALQAVDVRRPGSKRPSYRIPPEALDEFLHKRPGAVPKPTKRKRRRKKMDDQIIEFYS